MTGSTEAASGRAATIGGPLSLGFAAMAGQVIVLREALTVFDGNELSAGLALTAWLGWTAAGSLASRRWLAGRSGRPLAVSVLFLLLAAVLPLTLPALNLLPDLFGLDPGSGFSPWQVAIGAAGTLGPFAAFAGALFPLLVGSGPGTAARVYGLECLGGCAGGLAASLWLIPSAGPYPSAGIVSAVCLASSVLASGLPRERRGWPTAAVMAFMLLFLARGERLHEIEQLRWKESGRLLLHLDTPYGDVKLLAAGGQASLFRNGGFVWSAPDHQLAEESVHLPLLEAERLETVVVVGDCLSSLYEELARHRTIERIWCLSPDRAETDALRRLPGVTARLVDLRFVFVTGRDPRRWLATTDDRFDAIVVAPSDPITLADSRYYTREFFDLARGRLNPGGIFSLSLSYTRETLSPRMAAWLASVWNPFSEVFPASLALPAGRAVFIGKSAAGRLETDPQTIAGRLGELGPALRFVTRAALAELFEPFRLAQFAAALGSPENTAIASTDGRPETCLRHAGLWASLDNLGLGMMLGRLTAPALVAAVALLSLLLLLPGLRRRKRRRPVLAGIFWTGFTVMATEVVILFLFQIHSGAMYHWLGVLLGCFMAGMGIGALLGGRKGRPGLSWLHLVLAGLCLLPAAMAVAGLPAGLPGWLILTASGALLAAFGWSGGVYYAVAAARADGGPATAYASDLAGSALAGLLWPVAVIPLAGLVGGLLLLAGVNLVAAAAVREVAAN